MTGLNKIERAAWEALKVRKGELEDRITLLRAEVNAIDSQMFDLQISAYERHAEFKRGDVIEYLREIGWGFRAKKQTRRLLFLEYKKAWNHGIEPFWRALKKDMTISIKSVHSEYMRDREKASMQKIGTWDFENNKFIPLEENT